MSEIGGPKQGLMNIEEEASRLMRGQNPFLLGYR